MNTTIQPFAGCTVLSLNEALLDSAYSDEFRDMLLSLLEADGQHLIVDLSRVTFIDSLEWALCFQATRRPNSSPVRWFR